MFKLYRILSPMIKTKRLMKYSSWPPKPGGTGQQITGVACIASGLVQMCVQDWPANLGLGSVFIAGGLYLLFV